MSHADTAHTRSEPRISSISCPLETHLCKRLSASESRRLVDGENCRKPEVTGQRTRRDHGREKSNAEVITHANVYQVLNHIQETQQNNGATRRRNCLTMKRQMLLCRVVSLSALKWFTCADYLINHRRCPNYPIDLSVLRTSIRTVNCHCSLNSLIGNFWQLFSVQNERANV